MANTYSNRRTQSRRNTSHRDAYNGRNPYLYDNLARSQYVVREMEEESGQQISNETRKNREKAHHMNLAYMVFLIVALCCAGMVLVNYLQLQAEVTRRAEIIANKESELNTLRLSNDEDYNRIINSIDMEQIKQVAIQDLGMTYATEGKIQLYTNDGSDYMRKVAD